jgi:hypothetical protein
LLRSLISRVFGKKEKISPTDDEVRCPYCAAELCCWGDVSRCEVCYQECCCGCLDRDGMCRDCVREFEN